MRDGVPGPDYLLWAEVGMDGYSKDDLIRARAILVEVATKRAKISYTDFAARAGLVWDHQKSNDRKLIGEMLGALSHEEYRRGRPLITAVVVRKDTEMPGDGFLGIEGFPKSEEFWRAELKRVHDYWGWRTRPKGAGYTE